MSWLSRIRALILPRAERELDDEFQFHLDQQVAEFVAAGMPTAQAQAAARRALGGVALLKEECREARGANWLLDAGRDLRHALRAMRRSPGFTLAAVLTLALGIGANAAVFHIADAVLLKMLPVRDPLRLVRIDQPQLVGAGFMDSTSFVNYREMQTAAAPYLDLAGEAQYYTEQAFVGGNRETVEHREVSANYFAVLGVPPVLGRTFDSSVDDEPGRHPEAVISYAWWDRRFHLDPAVLGRTVRIGKQPFQIIGVAAPGFFGLVVGSLTDIWTPVSSGDQRFLFNRGKMALRPFGRLKPGATTAQALAPLDAWYHTMEADWIRKGPSAGPFLARLPGLHLKMEALAKGFSTLRHDYGEPIEIVFAVVAVVLLLACGNVASLLMARAGARRREMAVRLSLGAGRLRLIRQLLTESLLLAAGAAALGSLAALWAAPALVRMLAPDDSPVKLALGLDGRMLAFTAAVSLVTALAFGISPALRASKVELHEALKSGARLAGGGPKWQGRWLVALQMALSLVLLVASGLFVRTLLNLKALHPGFDKHNLLIAGAHSTDHPSDRLALAWLEALRRIAAIPGIESVSASIGGPFGGSSMGGPARIQGESAPILETNWYISISAHFFHTLGGRLAMGRDFQPRDFDPGAPLVAIVSETMARHHFGSANPLGHKIQSFQSPDRWLEIVGVAADMKYDSLRTSPPPLIYVPFTQLDGAAPTIMTFQIRAHRDRLGLAPALRRELAASGGDLVLNDILAQTKMVDDTLLRERLLAAVGSFFGFIALLLAALGLYGTVGYAVSRRTQEIGIRMALGARQGQVLRMILGEAFLPVAYGAAAGAVLAFFAAHAVAGLLFGIGPRDPAAILAPAAVLAATSLGAAFVPALRACRAAPVEALRNE